jgi:hypothetical protein
VMAPGTRLILRSDVRSANVGIIVVCFEVGL